jgi:hypothetical protein
MILTSQISAAESMHSKDGSSPPGGFPSGSKITEVSLPRDKSSQWMITSTSRGQLSQLWYKGGNDNEGREGSAALQVLECNKSATNGRFCFHTTYKWWQPSSQTTIYS